MVWQEIEAIEDPKLKELSELLPTVVLRGRAPSTVKKYSGAFLRWKSWTTQKFEYQAYLPAKPLHVALYLTYLIRKSSTSAPVEEASNAISWAHQVAVLEDPTQHQLIKQIVAGAKRILAHRTNKKEPITPEILAKHVNKFTGENADLDDIRIVAICLMSFAGFLRYNEVSALKESDLHIYSDHMEIFIEARKMDQYRDGAWVVIARTQTKTCPVHMMERYTKLANITGSPDLHLFCGIVSSENGVRRKQYACGSDGRSKE